MILHWLGRLQAAAHRLSSHLEVKTLGAPKSKSFLKSELQTCNGYVDYRFAVCRNNDERQSKTL